MKTEPMSQQSEGQDRLDANPEFYALGCEQGTGKTWMLLNDAERQFRAGKIEALLVAAPKGVHTNWAIIEIPKHLEVPHVARYWMAGKGKRFHRDLSKILEVPRGRLAILCVNTDSVNTAPGRKFIDAFLRRYKTMMVVDESHYIKNPDATRSAHMVRFGRLTASRRIASGTLIADTPLDLYGQYHFLRSGLLGTTSYRAFVAQYAELHSQNSPVVLEIKRKNPRAKNPQIIKTDVLGRPKYKGLEKLADLIQPFTYRVTKAQCLDLPEKIYSTHLFELPPAQMNLYKSVLGDRRLLIDDWDETQTYTHLTVITKLRQITSGFIFKDGQPYSLEDNEPRIKALEEILKSTDTQVIIWASFTEEIRLITDMLAKKFPDRRAVTYQGSTTDNDRTEAVRAFQASEAHYFVSNPSAGGTGITLTQGSTVVYYSCDFPLAARLQSEDRSHRIGTRLPVRYIDLVALGTIDEKIAASLQAKAAAAGTVMDRLS